MPQAPSASSMCSDRWSLAAERQLRSDESRLQVRTWRNKPRRLSGGLSSLGTDEMQPCVFHATKLPTLHDKTEHSKIEQKVLKVGELNSNTLLDGATSGNALSLIVRASGTLERSPCDGDRKSARLNPFSPLGPLPSVGCPDSCTDKFMDRIALETEIFQILSRMPSESRATVTKCKFHCLNFVLMSFQ